MMFDFWAGASMLKLATRFVYDLLKRVTLSVNESVHVLQAYVRLGC